MKQETKGAILMVVAVTLAAYLIWAGRDPMDGVGAVLIVVVAWWWRGHNNWTREEDARIARAIANIDED